MHHYWDTTINQANGIQKVTKFSMRNYKSKLEIKKEKEEFFKNLKNFFIN